MKKQIYKLDIEDLDEEGGGKAYIFFHTSLPGYLFVDDLNHLYGVSLERLDDLSLQGQQWPLYSYHDSLRKLDYYLIERPAGAVSALSHWAPGHKMMIVNGEKASDIAQQLYNDFNSPPPQPDTCNPEALERYEILSSYQQTLTPVTLYDPDDQTPSSRKILKERMEMENLFVTILDILDLSGIK